MSMNDCCMDSSDRIWIYFLFVLNLLLNIQKKKKKHFYFTSFILQLQPGDA